MLLIKDVRKKKEMSDIFENSQELCREISFEMYIFKNK